MTMRRRSPIGFDTLRRSRAAIVVFALLGLLFAQTALAFYSCPQLSSAPHEQAETPCAEMDMASPALCKAFVQGDTQGLDGPRAALDVDSAGPAHSVARALSVAPLRPLARRALFALPCARPPPVWIWFGRFRA